MASVDTDSRHHPIADIDRGLDVLKEAISEVSKMTYLIPEDTTSTVAAVAVAAQPPTIPKRGRIKHAMDENEESSDLFYPLGKGLYIDKHQMTTSETVLRMSLWRLKTFKMQTRDRFSVLLNMDALKRLQMKLATLWKALTMWSQESHGGYTLHLGERLYVSVERGDCMVHFRQWHVLDTRKYNNDSQHDTTNTDVELLPTRKGLKLDWDQFYELATFMSQDLMWVVPGYKGDVFKCNELEHVARTCNLCSPTGCLPMERQGHRIVADVARGVTTKETAPPLTRRQVYELSLRMKSSWYRLIWIMNLPEELGETMIGLATESGQVYPAVIVLLCWMLQNKHAPRIAHLMWLLDESGVEFEQEMYFADNNFDLFCRVAYDRFVQIGGFYTD